MKLVLTKRLEHLLFARPENLECLVEATAGACEPLCEILTCRIDSAVGLFSDAVSRLLKGGFKIVSSAYRLFKVVLVTIHVKATANEWSGVFLDFRTAEL